MRRAEWARYLRGEHTHRIAIECRKTFAKKYLTHCLLSS